MFHFKEVLFPTEPEILDKKRDLRRRAMLIGTVSLLLFVLSRGLSRAISFVAKLFGMSRETYASVFGNPAVGELLQMLLSASFFSFPFIWVLSVLSLRADDVIPFGKPDKKGTGYLLLFGLGSCAFANIAVSRAGQIFEGLGFNYSVSGSETPKGFFGVMLVILSTAVFPAVFEEFACRGVILGILRPFGDGFSIIASAAVFGLMHANFEQIPFAFLVGLVLGFIRVKSGSIWPAILLHFLNNFTSVLLDEVGDNLIAGAANTTYLIYLIAALGLGIYGLCLYLAKGGSTFYQKDEALTEDRKFLWFFTSPMIIIFICAAVLLSLQYFI